MKKGDGEEAEDGPEGDEPPPQEDSVSKSARSMRFREHIRMTDSKLRRAPAETCIIAI